jgi:putative DNA primase/helicase
MNAEQIANALGKAKRAGRGWLTRCPAHDDAHASLSISDADGKLLWNCKTGCSQLAVLEELKRQGYIESQTRTKPEPKAKKPEVQETYECSYAYKDENDQLLFQVHRYKTNDPKNTKTFKQQAADGTWSLKNVRRVLYNLRAVLRAKQSGQPIWLCEGEKDADNLIKLGFVATTNSSGAGTWSDIYTETLTGCDVILLPDNDRAGRNRVNHIANNLFGKAKSIKILELDVPEKGDVSDWLSAGHSLMELIKLSKNAPVMTEAPQIEEKNVVRIREDKEITGTDLASAKKFIEYMGDDLKFNENLGWYAWDQGFWKSGSALGVQEKAKEVTDALWKESETVSESERETYMKWAKKTQSRSAIENMIHLARSDKKVKVEMNEFDNNPILFNCLNGSVNLDTFELKEHDRNDLMTMKANVSFKSGTKCPKWLAFLDQIMDGDEDMIFFLQRAIGYTLTGHITEQKLFFCYGGGMNGKSVFLTVLQEIFGDYSKTIRANAIMDHKNDTQLDSLSSIVGRRFIRASEIADTAKLNEALIKDITGGEMIPARLLYKEPFEFRPVGKLWLHGNHKPRISGSDFGIWRRILLIPFEVTIPEAERDQHLVEKLLEEREGIFQWAVIGYHTWQAEGLAPPKRVTDATKEYEKESDTLGEFMSQKIEQNEFAEIRAGDFYRSYQRWCEQNGHKAWSHTRLGLELKRRGVQKTKKSAGYVYEGMRLITDGEDSHENMQTSIGFSY